MGREEVSDVSRRETAMWHRRTKVAGVLHFRVAAAGTPEWGLLLPAPQNFLHLALPGKLLPGG